MTTDNLFQMLYAKRPGTSVFDEGIGQIAVIIANPFLLFSLFTDKEYTHFFLHDLYMLYVAIYSHQFLTASEVVLEFLSCLEIQ